MSSRRRGAEVAAGISRPATPPQVARGRGSAGVGLAAIMYQLGFSKVERSVRTYDDLEVLRPPVLLVRGAGPPQLDLVGAVCPVRPPRYCPHPMVLMGCFTAGLWSPASRLNIPTGARRVEVAVTAAGASPLVPKPADDTSNRRLA